MSIKFGVSRLPLRTMRPCGEEEFGYLTAEARLPGGGQARLPGRLPVPARQTGGQARRAQRRESLIFKPQRTLPACADTQTGVSVVK